MKQDTLHIRDAVSKTITVTPQFATIISDFDHDEFVIPDEFKLTVEDMFKFAYNRADEFLEGKNGVMLSISGGLYPTELGDKAEAIYKAVKQ